MKRPWFGVFALVASGFSLALSAQPAFVAAHGTLCTSFTGTGGGTFQLPIVSTVPAGHALVLTMAVSSSGTAISSFTDTQGNSWTYLGASTNPEVVMYGTTVSNPLTTADHLNLGASVSAVGDVFAAVLAEYRGIGSMSTALDRFTPGSGLSSSPSETLSPATTQPSEILIGSILPTANPGPLPHALLSYTNANQVVCPGTTFLSQDYQVVSSTNTYTYGWVFQNTVPWGIDFISLIAGTSPVELLRAEAK